jgi:hypothetical protein
MNQTVNQHASERGAVSIKTLLTFAFIGAVILTLVKILPVYAEQRQIIFDVDELANKCAIRNIKTDDVKKAITELTSKYSLPEGSISLISHEQDRAQITLSYKKSIDFLVTKYDWKVDHVALGKAL